MPDTPVINSFNAGELSPYLYARNDLKKYNSGCLVLENFHTLPYGGAIRRPAIKLITEAKDNENIKLIEFEFSSEQTYILEFGDFYIRFIKDGDQLEEVYTAWLTATDYKVGELVTDGGSNYRCLKTHTSGTFATDLAADKWVLSAGATDLAYEIATPYAIADVQSLRVIQSADIMWIAHADYPVQKLSRFGDTDWTIEDETYNFPVFRSQNVDASLTLTSSVLTGSGTLTASSALFDANHVGSYWQLKHVLDTINLSTPQQPTAASLPTPSGSNDAIKANAGETIAFTTTRTWANVVLAVWRSDDLGVTWEQWRYYDMSGRNVDTSWDEDQNDILYCVTYTTGTAGAFTLVVNEAFKTGVVFVDAFTSSTVVDITVIREVGSTDPTSRWSEGAWSAFRGFPSTVALWESRLIFASTISDPNTIWLSTIDDFNNFNQTTLDDAAMTVTLGSGRLDEIRWLVPQRALIIGTAGSEWALEAESDNKPVTPSSFALNRKTTYGSTSRVQGILVNSAVLFVMRQGRKLREFVFQFDTQDYVAPDLTILAEHITEGGVIDAAYQQQPDNNVLAIRADGTMIPMTYERDQDVTGWQRWNSNDFTFESVAVLPRDEDEDAVYVSCKLTIDSVVKRYIGILDNREWGTNVATEWNGSDFYTVFNSPATSTITGLEAYEGKVVDIVRDGMVEPQQTVTGGEITITKTGDRVVVGLPYTSTMAPMYIEPPSQFNQPMGKHKGIFKAVIRFKDTIQAKVGQTVSKLETVKFRKTTDPMDTQIDLFSGEKKINFENKYELLHTCYVVQDKPLPITVVAMVPWLEVHN